MKHLVLIVSLIVAGCGGLPMTGQDGVDGRSPKCSVEKKADGKTYLKCVNPDGSAAESEIAAGGSVGEVESVAQCSMKNDLYSVRYNVLKVNDSAKLASMAVVNLKTPKVFYQGAVLHAEGDEGYAAAEIKLSAWSAKMTGEKKAEVTQVGGNPEAILCK